MEVDQDSFTLIVFTTTGEMGSECKLFYSQLASLTSIQQALSRDFQHVCGKMHA